ncbi:sulfate permease [Cryobacterium glaciale]|uniref:sulfate permease n=1 Tax=Cryobacterium glaciale TaxID=1259145 RepID=UPI001584036C|nr:sulfate permease [Cryobacterium glaciale]
MFGLILGVTARVHYALRGLMPTNILLDALRTRRGLKWGVPAMLLAVPYALAAVLCTGLAEDGGSGWFNLLALLFAWNALKFLVAGPLTLMRLLWLLGGEANARRRAARALRGEGVGLELFEEPVLTSRRA